MWGSTVTRIAGLVVLGLLLLAAPSQAAFPGKNGLIAFGSSNGIETIAPDGSSRTVVHPGGGGPVWSYDGTRIVYMSGGPPDGIYTMTAAGAPLTQCPCSGFNSQGEGSFPEWPTWAPDGIRIAYVTTVITTDQTSESIVVGRPGTGGGGGTFTFHPGWLEWGANNKIYFWQEQTDGGIGDEIRVLGGGDDVIRSVSFEEALGLTVSPDGARIAFGAEHSGSDRAIYRAQSDGSGAVRLSGPAPAKDSAPAWSPDGSKIVFQSTRDGNTELYVMNADGSNQTRLTNTPSINETNPDWQPIPLGFPRPKAATPMYVPLVPAYTTCGTPNRTHAMPLSFGSCAPPTQASTRATVGTPDSNGQAANATGFVRSTVVPGDVNLAISATDVRATGTLADYTGQLRMQAVVRATDKLNSPNPGEQEPATVQDVTFGPTVPCTGTAGTTIGSTCSLSTTANALIPGLVVAGARSNWEFDQVRLYDGGTDGDGDTQGDNTLFATQGLFVP